MITSATFTDSGSIIVITDDGWTMFVPDDPANSDRQAISAWEAAGHQITAYVALPSPKAARAVTEIRCGQLSVIAFGADPTGAADSAPAIQGAVDRLSSTGGTVYIPTGLYKCLSTITLPVTNISGAGAGVEINIVGDGPLLSRLSWTTDLGAGNFGILCASRAVAGRSCEGTISGIMMIGPAGHGATPTPGVSPAAMNGIGRGDRRRLRDIVISGFNAGLCVAGGQTTIESVFISGCGYGIYYDVSNPTLFGDSCYTKVTSIVNAIASIAVAENPQMSEETFISCLFGYSPFGLYKIKGAGSQLSLMVDCTFVNCQFEGVGNALIADDQTASTRIAFIGQCILEGCFFSWGTAFRWVAKDHDAIISISFASGIDMFNIHEANQWTPGSAGLLNFTFSASGRIEGDWDALLAGCVSAGVPVFPSTCGGLYGLAIERDGMWRGYPSVTHTANPLVGSVAVADASSGVQAVVYSVGTPAESPVGVYMSSCALNSFAVIANKGAVTVRTNGTPFNCGLALRTSSAGRAIQATGRNDATSAFLGIVGATVSQLVMTGL